MSENTEAAAAVEETGAAEAAATEKATAKKSKKTAKKTKQVEKVMYVGPTIPAIGIQNRVYTDVPESARQVIAETPEISNLFIPVIKYAEANRMLREQKGYIYSAYLRALTLKGGK